MTVEKNEGKSYIDDVARATRITSVDAAGNPTSSAPAVIAEGGTRYNTPGTRTVGAGKYSYSVTVVTGNYPTSPTLGGLPLPIGVHEYTAPGINTLTGLSLITASGDDVLVRTV